MGHQGGVGQHLVVHVGVHVGHLHDAVEGQDLAGLGVFEQQQVLELRSALLEHAPHRVRRLVDALRFVFLEPAGKGLFGPVASNHLMPHDALRLIRLLQHVENGIDVDVVTAGEVVERRIPELGPGVDREMALRDHGHRRDTLRGELVDHQLHEGGLARSDGLAKGRFRQFRRVQVRRTPELANRVLTKSYLGDLCQLSPSLCARLIVSRRGRGQRTRCARKFRIDPANSHSPGSDGAVGD